MSIFNEQKDFMIACGQTVNKMNEAQAKMYMKLIDEEKEELEVAVADSEVLDALIDLIVVIVGYGLSSGYDMQGAWDEVMRSNMAKIDPQTGTVIKREDGKILKPHGWTPPDLGKFIG